MPGRGQLILTGQLGKVMQESARTALSYVQAHLEELGIEGNPLDGQDLHIHVPAGAMPKDGPSAGVAMVTAVASLASGRSVRADTAMTGEISLRGGVLPIGGLKQKVLGAKRARIRQVIYPAANQADLEEIPVEFTQGLTFLPVETIEDVLDAALGPVPRSRSKRRR
jgi:ATP-dependent Lon protease